MPEPLDAASAVIVDGTTGARIGPAEVVTTLAGARHIYVGERHADPGFHAVQLATAEALRHVGRHVVVGVEWLPKSKQAALDAWLGSEEGDLDDLQEAVAWKQTWGHAFAAYAPIFAWAHRHQIPIVALNAERGLARQVAIHGQAARQGPRGAELPPLDSGNPAHKAYFMGLMKRAAEQHPSSGSKEGSKKAHAHAHHMAGAMDRYYLAQLVWDETMSRGVATLLEDPRVTVVVFAGLGHVDFGHGVPQRARDLSDLPFRIVRVVPAGEAAAEAAAQRGATTYPDRQADIFWELPSGVMRSPKPRG